MTRALEYSFKARLKNIARERRVDPAILWQNLVLERFLVRVCRSHFSSHFILKGGMLLASYIDIRRHTKDLDFLVRRLDNQPEHLRPVLQHIIDLPIDDGFRFESLRIGSLPHPDMKYPGIRANMRALFGKTRLCKTTGTFYTFFMLISFAKPTASDIPLLLELFEETYRLHYSLDPNYYVPWTDEVRARLEQYVTSAITKDKPHILAARDDDHWLGFILYEISNEDGIDTHFKRCGVIVEFVVTESSRGQGIGRQLLAPVESYFAEQGIKHLKLFCSTSNPMAHRFYEREGYTSRQQLFCKLLDVE